jgi:hypothetical protein
MKKTMKYVAPRLLVQNQAPSVPVQAVCSVGSTAGDILQMGICDGGSGIVNGSCNPSGAMASTIANKACKNGTVAERSANDSTCSVGGTALGISNANKPCNAGTTPYAYCNTGAGRESICSTGTDFLY